jgi:hypothetical protein
MKAYRCLKRSKVVLAVIGALQLAAYVIFIIGLPTITVSRELSGWSKIILVCRIVGLTTGIQATASTESPPHSSHSQYFSSLSSQGLSFAAVSLLLLPNWAFVSDEGIDILAVLYAVINSSRRTATQGRMSIALSSVAGTASVIPIVAQQNRAIHLTQGINEKRGWWDYVPDNHVGVGIGGPGGPGFNSSNYTAKKQGATDETHIHPVERWRTKIVSTIWKRADAPPVSSRPASPGAETGSAPRKPSIHADEPIPHPKREAFGTSTAKRRAEAETATNQMPELELVDSRTGLATGVESARTGTGARPRGKSSKLIKSSTDGQSFSGMMRIPKMMLLRAVMKDEVRRM